MTKQERIAYQRTFVVKDYQASGLRLLAYSQQYNARLAAGLLEGTSLQKSISVPTLSRWVAAYKRGGVAALQPQYAAGKGAGASLSDQEKALLQSYWLHQNQLSVAGVCDLLQQQHGIYVSYHVARRYLQALPQPLKIARRQGPTAYKNKVENYISKDYSLIEVMQQVCADHHTLDLRCVEKLGDRPFRPYLSAFIDMRSRRLLSWQINRQAPTQWTVMAVLEQLIADHGLPECVIIDNGKDFTAQNLTGKRVSVKCEFEREVEIELKGVFAELGCDVVRTTPYHGQAKWIERLFRFICERFSKQFDTYTGSNTVTRPEDSKLYDRAIAGQAKKSVMLSLNEVRDAFCTWANWYNNQWHHNGHSMHGQTANEVWTLRKTRVQMPAHLMERVFCRSEIKLFCRAGVRMSGVDYYNPELAAEYFGRKLIVKRPFRDISKCFLYSLGGCYLGEAHSRAELGLIDKGVTEDNIAVKKRLNKRLNKATKSYEEALGDVQRTTIQHQHRRPLSQKFSQTFAQAPTWGKAAGAEDWEQPDTRIPSLLRRPIQPIESIESIIQEEQDE